MTLKEALAKNFGYFRGKGRKILIIAVAIVVLLAVTFVLIIGGTMIALVVSPWTALFSVPVGSAVFLAGIVAFFSVVDWALDGDQ